MTKHKKKNEIMKKLTIVLLLVCFAFSVKAQQDSVKYIYCEIVGTSKFLSTKVTVVIDFGQATNFFLDTKYKDPTTGKPMVFNSMIDALNFMGKSGWEFTQAYIIGDAQNGYVYHFLLKNKNP